jgi:hypothetical protein
MTDTKLMTEIEAQANLDAAAATAREWRDAVETIRGKLETTRARVAAIQRDRKGLALEAALGKPDATKALADLHDEQAAAEKLADDLVYGLEQAKARQAAAEAAHAAAILALNRAQAKAIIEARIQAAIRFDIAMADADSALQAYQRGLVGLPDIDGPGGPSMSTIELREGTGRARAAIGQGLRRLLNLGGETQALAQGERAIWRAAVGD